MTKNLNLSFTDSSNKKLICLYLLLGSKTFIWILIVSSIYIVSRNLVLVYHLVCGEIQSKTTRLLRKRNRRPCRECSEKSFTIRTQKRRAVKRQDACSIRFSFLIHIVHESQNFPDPETATLPCSSLISVRLISNFLLREKIQSSTPTFIV
jgi:hypothetical protein